MELTRSTAPFEGIGLEGLRKLVGQMRKAAPDARYLVTRSPNKQVVAVYDILRLLGGHPLNEVVLPAGRSIEETERQFEARTIREAEALQQKLVTDEQARRRLSSSALEALLDYRVRDPNPRRRSDRRRPPSGPSTPTRTPPRTRR